MSSLSETSLYRIPDSHLAQGDIFKYPVVAPIGDTEIRIFRSTDAKHGSWVFESGAPCKVFGIEDLNSVLTTYPGDMLRTKPFQKTFDNQPEMTIVYSDLIHYFIIASQTCDISGEDEKPELFTTIIPLTTFKDYCENIILPLEIKKDGAIIYSKNNTIIGFISEFTDCPLAEVDEVIYLESLREIIEKWSPPKHSLAKGIKGKIKDTINKITSNNYNFLHFIKSDSNFGVPSGFADFTRFINIPTEILSRLKTNRIATICSPFREHFSSRIGSFLSRVGLPFSPTEKKL